MVKRFGCISFEPGAVVCSSLEQGRGFIYPEFPIFPISFPNLFSLPYLQIYIRAISKGVRSPKKKKEEKTSQDWEVEPLSFYHLWQTCQNLTSVLHNMIYPSLVLTIAGYNRTFPPKRLQNVTPPIHILYQSNACMLQVYRLSKQRNSKVHCIIDSCSAPSQQHHKLQVGKSGFGLEGHFRQLIISCWTSIECQDNSCTLMGPCIM